MSSVRATVLYDYVKREDDELNLRKNDIVEVLQKHDDDWWQVRRGKEVGMIPANYVYVTVSSPRESKSVASPPKWGSPAVSKNNHNDSRGVYNNSKSDYRNNNGNSNSSSPSAMNSTDLRRLKELREEADKKIGALR